MTHEFFDISPKLLSVGTPTAITVRSRFALTPLVEQFNAGNLKLQWIADNGLLQDGRVARWAEYNELSLDAIPGDCNVFRFSLTPAEEGELHCRIVHKENRKCLLEFGLYALEPDLAAWKPFRGDFHVHSNHSECGSENEDPLYVTAVARMRGLDFMALTDHMQHGPSLRMRDFWETSNSAFRVFPGEEVHLLAQPVATLFRRNNFLPAVHIVNIGGERGIVQYQNEHFAEYQENVKRRAAELDPGYDESVRFLMAGADWICDKIHEFGGAAIFCHPFWKPLNRWNLPSPVREHILRENRFDAMEVIGLGSQERCSVTGEPDSQFLSYRESNNLCLNWWRQESVRRGRLIPLVGDTDSHRSMELLGFHYTIVFAKDNSPEQVVQAIREGRSLAVVAYPGEIPLICGDFRLTRFAQFLLREYWPQHDADCEQEGKTLLRRIRDEGMPESNFLL